MSEHVFFSTESRHNERLIRILSVGSLVSKPPAKEKRISIKARMPLSGNVNMGASEKIDHAYMFVAQNHQKVTLDNEFDGYCIELSVENLFGEPIIANDCSMKSFEIFEMGKEEAPDVVMTFTIRTKYSAKKWEWLGNFVGEDVWAKFTPGEIGTAKVENEQDGTLLDDGENDTDEDEGDLDPDNETEGFNPELDTPEELEYESGPALVKKSGPKELTAYHEQVVEGEQKRGRGRPRKIPQGFTKPLNQPEF